jgi:hypothetical protein
MLYLPVNCDRSQSYKSTVHLLEDIGNSHSTRRDTVKAPRRRGRRHRGADILHKIIIEGGIQEKTHGKVQERQGPRRPLTVSRIHQGDGSVALWYSNCPVCKKS